jgi:hypothetical protein
MLRLHLRSPLVVFRNRELHFHATASGWLDATTRVQHYHQKRLPFFHIFDGIFPHHYMTDFDVVMSEFNTVGRSLAVNTRCLGLLPSSGLSSAIDPVPSNSVLIPSIPQASLKVSDAISFQQSWAGAGADSFSNTKSSSQKFIRADVTRAFDFIVPWMAQVQRLPYGYCALGNESKLNFKSS